MIVRDFNYEYDSLSPERRDIGLKKLFDEILSDTDGYSGLIYEVLGISADYEADDGFGTEGLDI